MKIKNILISQQEPKAASPYTAISEKFGVRIDFKPFFVMEPLSSREFRAQRTDILSFSAIVFSSRSMIDAFFHLCEELRVKIPDTMKYFCTTEVVAMYLQKHIVYRKRKIFFGDGTPASVISLIGSKHNGEKFLIATSTDTPNSALTKAFEQVGVDYDTSVFLKPVYQDLKDIDVKSYDMIVMYNQADLKSLLESYPDFVQGDTKFVAYGRSVNNALVEAGYGVEIAGPTPEAPSVAKALETYLAKA
ncbi:MAG: uroporphyrinogen-III synthase [Bacteroidales bacterium]|nr:uroporphyrinogen-III synthase [Bacteroidales bacterium]